MEIEVSLMGMEAEVTVKIKGIQKGKWGGGNDQEMEEVVRKVRSGVEKSKGVSHSGVHNWEGKEQKLARRTPTPPSCQKNRGYEKYVSPWEASGKQCSGGELSLG